MDHGDHSGHDMPGHDMPNHDMPDHGGMDHGGCVMNTAFNTDPTGLCLVFPSLRISSPSSISFPSALLFLILVSFLYEFSRKKMRAWEYQLKPSSKRAKRRLSGDLTTAEDLSRSDDSLLGRGRVTRDVSDSRRIQVFRSAWYTLNIAISFYLMLIVMSFNAWLIGAVLIGAFVGHFVFHQEIGDEGESKGMACH